ncbi:hypothetical protein [Tenacibaculum crassostreae]|uniref:hypothetical protein n=1 Tax=Tenacibaculum crassostreae TaxID=502683 RepID=UPI0038937481
MTKNITLLILILIISSCSAQENFKDYYYQIGTKKEIKVYKYVDKNSPKNIEYWKVTTNPKTNKIMTESFTTDFRLYNIFEEELKTDGAQIIRYADFEVNDNGQNTRISGTIVDKDVYKWNDNNKYIYSVKYTSPKYGNEQFIKERTKSGFENITVSGTEYSTLKFKDEYEIKSLENDQNYEFYQFTYYAKGIGMVKYQRYHPNGTTIELELTEILTEKEFDELKEKASR